MSRPWSDDSALRNWLRPRVAIDPRALAAFRIALGTVLLLDVLTRLRHFRALYTDAGVLPRSAVLASYGGAYEVVLSLPDPWFPAISFLALAVAALALIAGYRSRLAAVCALVGLVTIQMRNPFVLNGGDVLLRILVIWALFLPLGRRWTLSAAPVESAPVVSVATAGALVQVVLVYVVNATHKLDSEAWRSGEAVAGVFRTEQYTYLLADAIGDTLLGTGVLATATYAWFALLLVSPLLVLATGRVRSLLVSLFVAAHLGMLVTLSVGLFPLVSITGLLLLYPPRTWDWLARVGARRSERAWLGDASAWLRRGGARARAGASTRVRQARERASSTAPALVGALARLARFPERAREAAPPHVRRRARSVVLVGLPAVILVASLVSAAAIVAPVDQPDATASAVETADIGQDWGMFAPNPPETTWWIAAPADRADGSDVDAIQGRQLDKFTPEHADRIPSFRWRKYYEMLRGADTGPQRSQFARYLCEREDIETVELYYGYERVDPDGTTERGGETLLVYDCDGPTIQN